MMKKGLHRETDMKQTNSGDIAPFSPILPLSLGNIASDVLLPAAISTDTW